MKKIFIIAIGMLTLASYAKVDLVTLPDRDSTQLTIYNSADLTLVRDNRNLTVRQGENKLQFSWANTLIDPTSIDIMPKLNGESIDIFDLSYPAGTKNLGYWTINSKLNGKNPFEISYLTSGLTWNAFYLATLSSDQQSMNLDAYVKVTNNSGEDYDNAQVRLIVGKINTIDTIADLARRQYPYGSPITSRPMKEMEMNDAAPQGAFGMKAAKSRFATADKAIRRKEIKKEGLSEYFLYTIEGTESIPNTWSKRLPSFDVQDIKINNLYKYDEQRYGTSVRRFLYFKNDKEHKLGETPIPGGSIVVYGNTKDKQLTYEGESYFKYIPVKQEVELSLGSVRDVAVEIKKMKETKHNYMFDPKNNGRIVGWDLTTDWDVEIKNMLSIPVSIEITRNVNDQYWSIKNIGRYGEYIKDDMNTFKYKLKIPANSDITFKYILTEYEGRRAVVKK